MTLRSFFIVLLAIAGCTFLGCKSDSSPDQRLKAEAEQKVSEDDQQRQESMAHPEAVRGIELEKQNQLDAVEQRRTGNVYAHSCRKAVGFAPSMPASVDTKGCTPEQLKLEQEAERRQMFDDAMKSAKENK